MNLLTVSIQNYEKKEKSEKLSMYLQRHHSRGRCSLRKQNHCPSIVQRILLEKVVRGCEISVDYKCGSRETETLGPYLLIPLQRNMLEAADFIPTGETLTEVHPAVLRTKSSCSCYINITRNELTKLRQQKNIL